MSPTTPPSDRLLHEVRLRATQLLKAARAGEPDAIARLGGHLKRRHALDLVAREFAGLPYEALREGAPLADPARFFDRPLAAFWNHWFSSYAHAAAHLRAQGGFLFPFGHRQFVVVESHLLRALGLDPEDLDWQRIGRDWARPADGAAYRRLNAQLCAAGFAAAEGV